MLNRESTEGVAGNPERLQGTTKPLRFRRPAGIDKLPDHSEEAEKTIIHEEQSYIPSICPEGFGRE